VAALVLLVVQVLLEEVILHQQVLLKEIMEAQEVLLIFLDVEAAVAALVALAIMEVLLHPDFHQPKVKVVMVHHPLYQAAHMLAVAVEDLGIRLVSLQVVLRDPVAVDKDLEISSLHTLLTKQVQEMMAQLTPEAVEEAEVTLVHLKVEVVAPVS
jgi:hypothetical protein